jgi:hypothetical protein
VDWNALASRILAILLTLKRQRRTALKQTARRGISLEQLTAAAITSVVAEFVEGETTVAPRARLWNQREKKRSRVAEWPG